MKKLICVALACILLSTASLAQNSGYVVTDLKGVPEVEEPSDIYAGSLDLLKKIQYGTIVLGDKEKLTLTSLKDGSRYILTGPVTGVLDSKGFKRKSGAKNSVETKPGRNTGNETAQLKTVSSTMGAGAVRGGGPFLASRGSLLKPELVWMATETHPACRLTLHKDGEVIKEWPEVKGVLTSDHFNPPTVVDIADLGLEHEEVYFLNFIPLTEREGRLVPDPENQILDKDFKLVSSTVATDVANYETEARAAYESDPSDLSPLTSYLAFLLNKKLYCAALRLLYEPEFKDQIAMKADIIKELGSK